MTLVSGISNTAFVFGPISLLSLSSAIGKDSVGHCDKEGTEVEQLISLVSLLATGLQAAPRNSIGFFASPPSLSAAFVCKKFMPQDIIRFPNQNDQ